MLAVSANAQMSVSQVPLADPYILLDDGVYYAYGTHDANGIEYWTSTDLHYWQYGGLALSKANTSEQQWFWAPEVYQKNGKYYMYFSANEHLFVATADSPRGPFRQLGSYLMNNLIGDEKCIDSSVFFDEDGSAHLYFVRFTDGNCIWTCDLANDYVTPVAGTLKLCFAVSAAWENKLGRVCEGPFMLKHNGLYYLTYSANDYRSQDYGVGFARARNANGAWTKWAKNPILQRTQGLVGTGHHSFFTDKDGQLRIVFHAHNSASEVQPRLMYIGSAEFNGSELSITDEPFIVPQEGPAPVAAAEFFTPYKSNNLRLPSVPLLTNDPYFSYWSPFDQLTDGTTRHWSNIEKPIDGILRVDGTAYRFLGTGQGTLLTSIAPMAGEEAWEARVSYDAQSSTAWTQLNFDDSSWSTEKAAWGSKNEYPNVRNSWTATNSDIYVRRTVNLTAADLKKDLWIQFSHDDVFELYINGTRVISTGETWLQGEKHQLTAEERSKLRLGENIIAAHCHNTSGGAYIDFGLFENTFETAEGVQTAVQKSVDVMATSTYYTFTCGPVELDLVFTAPMIITDLDLISTPINYISYQVRSTDDDVHDVQFYLSTTPILTVNEPYQAVDVERITERGVNYLRAGSTAQPVLKRTGDLISIDWGYLYMPDVNGTVSFALTATMESTFVNTGSLPTCSDKVTGQSPANHTTLAYCHDFGSVKTDASYMMIGYDEVLDIRYFGKDYPGYWARDGKTITQAFDDFRDNYDRNMRLARQQDQTIYDDGLAVANTQYAELLSSVYRQVMAAHKLFQDEEGHLLFFSKENNSNGCVNTVDLTYPSAPLFLMYNTDLEKGMMTSIFEYSKTGRWKKQFAAHDLGTYPHANGQVYGGDMPLEESGNMLTLAATICKLDGNTDWIDNYWGICSQWVRYLVRYGQDPAEQLCTDDFAGHWAHNANLSIKAIMGVAAYAEIARMKGLESVYEEYMQTAREMATQWMTDADDGDHYRLAFDRENTWSQKYNLVWDQMWGLNLFPGVADKEIAYYLNRQNRYGLPLDSRRAYTKSDWIMWTASMANTKRRFQAFSNFIWKWANETTTRWPMSDWYNTDAPTAVGFRARSVVGGFWMKVLMDNYAVDPTDAIHEVTPDKEPNTGILKENEASVYDLSGRRLDTKNLRPGIYIVGNRKVVLK